MTQELSLKSQVIQVDQNSNFAIKYAGKMKGEFNIRLVPQNEGVSITLTIICIFTDDSEIKLDVGIENINKISKYNYSLVGKVFVTDTSKAIIIPRIGITDINIHESHKVSIGGIDHSSATYLSSKGYDFKDIKELFIVNVLSTNF